MAISIEISKNSYIGDGSTTTFPYDFKIFTPQDLDVRVLDLDDVETQLVYPSDFDVTGVGQPNGGAVILSSPLTDLYKTLIRRRRHLIQGTSIRNDGPFFPSVHETTFDKLVMLDQQQQEQIDRSLKLNDFEDDDFDASLPLLFGRTQRVLGTNAAGDGLDLGPTFDEVAQANQAAIDALSAATAALISETTAATNATNAAIDAAAAAASAASAATNGFDSTNSPHNVLDGQAATNLTGETFDGTLYSSVFIIFEVLRGTTVMAVGTLVLNYLNGTWRFEEGSYGGEVHGVTWSLSQATTIGQLKAALDVGAGNGKIKFKKTLFPA